MTIRITTTRAVAALVLALAYVALTPATPAAADREHQQIMADLRILQEQTQQLQALMTDLGEALKAVNSRIEDQTSLERKAFADGKVQMDTMSGDLRIVREKVDETNVRLGTITQELESLRAGDSGAGAVSAAAGEHRRRRGSRRDAGRRGATADRSDDAPGESGHSAAAAVRQLVRRLHGGNYVLAVQGFESYLRYFPKSTRAHEAQLYIGESLAWQKKDMDAVDGLRSGDRELSGIAIGSARRTTSAGWRSSGWEKPRARASRTKRSSSNFQIHNRRSSPSNGSNRRIGRRHDSAA